MPFFKRKKNFLETAKIYFLNYFIGHFEALLKHGTAIDLQKAYWVTHFLLFHSSNDGNVSKTQNLLRNRCICFFSSPPHQGHF